MRDLLIFAIVFGLLAFIPKRPAIGALAFAWISLMNPHRLTYGAAYDFPFAAIIATVTLISLFLSQQQKRFPLTPVTVMVLLFAAWTSVTGLFALEPDLVWAEWNRVSKTLFMTTLTILVINSEKDVKAFAAVVGLSLAFYGLKGGIFTLSSGGNYRVYGPAGTYIEDNNALALGLLTSVPLIWYLKQHVRNRWVRIGFIGVAISTVIAVVGSYSRGALLGGLVMVLFLWLKSRNKLGTAIVLSVTTVLVYSVMPEKWFDRMASIDDYKDDGSSMGRINAWRFAINVAKDNLMGGGFNVFSHKMFFVYAPDPLDHHAAHSIYFQVLGEQGFIGLTLFLLLMLFTWRTGTRVRKFCRGKENLKWASDLAAMCQVSLVGFAVGGAFLSLAYYDLYYDLIALLVLLDKIVALKSDSSKSYITNTPLLVSQNSSGSKNL